MSAYYRNEAGSAGGLLVIVAMWRALSPGMSYDPFVATEVTLLGLHAFGLAWIAAAINARKQQLVVIGLIAMGLGTGVGIGGIVTAHYTYRVPWADLLAYYELIGFTAVSLVFLVLWAWRLDKSRAKEATLTESQS